jgi:membrane protein YdbS with pleckstrin-like domain
VKLAARAVRLTLLLVLVATVVGAWSGNPLVVTLAAAAEVLVIAVVVVALLFDRGRALTFAEALFTRLVVRLLTSELRMLAVLPLVAIRSARRRRSGEFYYDKSNTFGMIAAVFAIIGAVEGAVVGFVLKDRLPWAAALDLILTAYAILWLLALAVSPRVYPHRLRDGALDVRLGFLYRITVPLAQIAKVERKDRADGWRSESIIEGHTALFRVDGRTNVDLALHSALPVQRPFGDPVEVRRISLAVDELDGFISALRHRQATAAADDLAAPGQPSGQKAFDKISGTTTSE